MSEPINGDYANGTSTLDPGQMVRRTVSSAGSSRELSALNQELGEMRQSIDKLLARNSTDQGVFDMLHSELRDYKNDFFYERLKPVVRPLLFLHDSIEDYENELRANGNGNAGTMKNLEFFREQLEEILIICEVTPITETHGAFDSSIHKSVELAQVAPEQNGQIVRVLKSGWYLNGNLMRPVEVAVGKSK